MSKASSPPSTPTRATLSRPPSSPSPLRPNSPTTPRSVSGPATLPSRRASAHFAQGAPLSPATPGGSGQKPRARDLLRKHYGLGVGPPTPSGGRGAADPMDLDSTAFDAKAYYEQLITTSSLPALLRKENELLNDIRELDSERQSLVYNHHHELIAASDTIAAMKARAENLDAEMDLLKVAFSEISRLSAEVAVEHTRPDDAGTALHT
ncbi:vacuolar protein sorting-associated family 51 protein [Phanerochaete sordida]|uniref:Vacuolar protein sorting-associated protein 51 homolog n=1 Tax=Phanerochaete sordida TaxID=48140 RepID=A0A9P3GH92_9APHY|nr:vacuolar protein sorting-associated family 51 protein [Phanerochaete sordida]